MFKVSLELETPTAASGPLDLVNVMEDVARKVRETVIETGLLDRVSESDSMVHDVNGNIIRALRFLRDRVEFGISDEEWAELERGLA